MFETLIFFVLGLVLLIGGADLLVRGSSKVALIAGLSPLVIGLTIVAFGTSAPELAINIQSAFQNQSDIALGNVIGSNIFNILLILGISAMITPLMVQKQLIRLDVPILILVTTISYFICIDRIIERFEGLLMFGGLIFYLGFILRYSKEQPAEIQFISNPELSDENVETIAGQSKIKKIILNFLLIVVGLTMLIFGADRLVTSAVQLARFFGVSELIIGLTIVAGGTSLPEVATSVVAAIKGEKDIAVGNVIGSNLFNLLAVLGATAIIVPQGITVSKAVLYFDYPFMLAVTIATLPIFFTGLRISRWEGFVFFGYYVAYTLYLILDAIHHDSLQMYSHILFYYVTPIIVLTILITFIHALKSNRQKKQRN